MVIITIRLLMCSKITLTTAAEGIFYIELLISQENKCGKGSENAEHRILCRLETDHDELKRQYCNHFDSHGWTSFSGAVGMRLIHPNEYFVVLIICSGHKSLLNPTVTFG